MAYKIAFFGAKPYDIASFDKVNEKYNYDIRYYKGHLNPNNVVLTQIRTWSVSLSTTPPMPL